MLVHSQRHQPKEVYTETSVEYIDEVTAVRLVVDPYNPGYPGHPKITLICPDRRLSLEAINAALSRLRIRARIPAEDFPDLHTEEIH